MPQTKYNLIHHRAVGDTVVMTALVRDLKQQHPELQLSVETNWREVWDGNPYIVSATKQAPIGWTNVHLCYHNLGILPAERGEPLHFLQSFYRDFTSRTKISVQITTPRPDLHLLPGDEQRLINGRYWVVMAGGKHDVTIKHWDYNRYQEIVDRLLEKGIQCVQAGAHRGETTNPVLKNVLNLVGRTSIRDFMRLVAQADGVICPITAAMHIAAAFEKPCVVIAGGREAWWWEAYTPLNDGLGPQASQIRVPHTYLHTLGLLPCCENRGCWMNKTIPVSDEDRSPKGRKKLCKDTVREPTGVTLPRCMSMITVDHVIEAVMAYYGKGYLPPINPNLPPVKKEPVVEIHQSPDPTQILSLLPGMSLTKPAVAEAAPSATPEASPKPLEIISPGVPVSRIALTLQPPSPPVTKMDVTGSLLDHSIIGGKLTVFVLCYGDYPDLAKRCLTSIRETISSDRLDLRIGANACSAATLAYLQSVPCTKLYNSSRNLFKYPMMRMMFTDPACPIQTSHLVWFDDDSYVANPKWVEELAKAIIDNHPQGARMYGCRFTHDLKHYANNGYDPTEWFRLASWWKGRNLQTKSGAEAPNGSVIHFATGAFWALHVPTMLSMGIPDRRLQNNGGDITIGEQVHQGGWKLKDFNRNKAIIASSMSPRRGASQKFPWDPLGAKMLAETIVS